MNRFKQAEQLQKEIDKLFSQRMKLGDDIKAKIKKFNKICGIPIDDAEQVKNMLIQAEVDAMADDSDMWSYCADNYEWYTNLEIIKDAVAMYGEDKDAELANRLLSDYEAEKILLTE